jgi:hypothetical protein
MWSDRAADPAERVGFTVVPVTATDFRLRRGHPIARIFWPLRRGAGFSASLSHYRSPGE